MAVDIKISLCKLQEKTFSTLLDFRLALGYRGQGNCIKSFKILCSIFSILFFNEALRFI